MREYWNMGLLCANGDGRAVVVCERGLGDGASLCEGVVEEGSCPA